MAQLISIGNIIVNLDQIAMLDIDPVPNQPAVRKVRIITNNGSAPTDVFIHAQIEGALLNLVEPKMRFPAVAEGE